jgi:hypothetical protein
MLWSFPQATGHSAAGLAATQMSTPMRRVASNRSNLDVRGAERDECEAILFLISKVNKASPPSSVQQLRNKGKRLSISS